MKKQEETQKIDPRVKDVLILLASGTFFAASIIMPGLPIVVKPFLDYQRRKKQKEWNKFNMWRLKHMLKRLYEQKLVEIVDENEIKVVKISDKGKKKVLKYNIEEMELKNKTWDGKWRIIIYDIFSNKNWERELFRKTLKRMKFLKLQRSVYLTPFKCDDEIEYLRQVCNIGKEVSILTVSKIENEQVYKEYFGVR